MHFQLVCHVTVVALLHFTPTLGACQEAEQLPNGVALGVSAGAIFGEDFSGIPSLAVNLTRLRRDGVGVDLAIATFPSTMLGGAVTIMPDLSVAYNFAVPSRTFLAKVGISTVAGLSGDGAGIYGGLFGGVGMIARQGARRGIRIDLGQRRFPTQQGVVYSITVGLTGLPVLEGSPPVGRVP
jgi:hypothetical protein